jgi:peptidoglycan/LPS O-acetylase OafA/YrhL
MAHVKGLNSLRAVLAITVTMCHIYMVDVWTTAPLSILIKKIYILLSYGPAAVLGFFVVSGFCIHYGNADDPFEPTVFYRLRYVRITIPLAVAVSLALGIHISYLPWNSVTWSLACEEIYYFIYPIFRNRFFPRIGILKNVLLAYAVGYLVLVGTDYHHSLIGTLRLAIGYFPAWLLGCALAEQWKRQNRTSPPKPSNWLSSVWDIGVLYGFVGIILIAKNHWPYEWVMPIFGFGFLDRIVPRKDLAKELREWMLRLGRHTCRFPKGI